MKITIEDLAINDGSEIPMMSAVVHFHDDASFYQKNAKVRVYIEKTITDLDQIKQIALQRAYEFLTTVQSTRSS